MVKIQPAVMTLNFETSATDNWIDLSQAASIVNRRFYRQGLQWAVAGITVQLDSTAQTAGGIRVETLPHTWVCSNAWHKVMANWLKQQNEALAESGQESIAAKFRDFKIFMDLEHVQDYVDAGGDLNATNLLPRTAVQAFAPGEWQPSQVVIPNSSPDASGSEVDPTEYFLHMVGNGVTGVPYSRGMIAGYAYSRSVPQSPDPAVPAQVAGTGNWLRDMFDVGNDDTEILNNAENTNNDLPYDQMEYPHGASNGGDALELHSQHYITNRSLGNRLEIPGLMVPCGLLKITNDTGVTAEVQIHLCPGEHRGYLAAPMQDM